MDRKTFTTRTFRCPWALTLSLALAALTIYALPGAPDALQYDRAAIAGGQWWRLVTGHLTHWNGDHLFWDLLMFVILGGMVERDGRLRLALLSLAAASGISLAVWWGQPDLQTYRGLSGVDTALFTCVACTLLGTAVRSRRWWEGLVPAVLLAGFAAKLAYETLSGSTLFVDSEQAGFVVVVLAHLVGAAIGAVFAVGAHHDSAAASDRLRSRFPWVSVPAG